MRKKGLPKVIARAAMNLNQGVKTKARVGSGLSKEQLLFTEDSCSLLVFGIAIDAIT